MLMVMVSASDRSMNDEELAKIGEVVRFFPVFQGYSQDRLVATAETASHALAEEGGLESVLDAIRASDPRAAARHRLCLRRGGGRRRPCLAQEELRMLQMIRDALASTS
jgi:hypothetical protein